MKHKDFYISKANIFKSISHPTRLFIVETLHKKPHCVQELTALLDVDISTVSKHLSILKQAGVLSCKKKGLEVFYQMECPCIIGFIKCVEKIIKKDAHNRVKLLHTASC